MEKYELFKQSVAQSDVLSTLPYEDVEAFAMVYGNQLFHYQGLYQTYMEKKENYEVPTIFGSKSSVTFDWDKAVMTFWQGETKLEVSIEQFIQLMNLVELTFIEKYPIGSVVELNIDWIPTILKREYEKSIPKFYITGRNIPLIDPFEDYVIDYRLTPYPIGELVGIPPLFSSSHQIKRLIVKGVQDEDGEKHEQEQKINMIEEGKLSSKFLSKELEEELGKHLMEKMKKGGNK